MLASLLLSSVAVLETLSMAGIRHVSPFQPNPPPQEPPNIVLIMTDDQGYGDFGFHENPVLRTPHLDALAAASARMSQFYVHPVCTPTRAALMTGRYPQRTRAYDTYVGRAMMEPEEVTLAEVLQDAGWATGIFGKWHLGDAYPMRPQDQGFDEALVHRGGGIGQPSDPEGGEGRYTDPVLFHNGEEIQTHGYCTEVYVTGAIQWIRQCKEQGRPFFAYLATNAPHGPFQDVPEKDYEGYRQRDLSGAFQAPEIGHALPASFDADRHARIFAMITDLDRQVGRLIHELKTQDLLHNTLILFLVDNGPNSRRHVNGMRGMKGQVYEGGVRSPLWAHWPARLIPGSARDEVVANIDLMPTILEACGLMPPPGLHLDGRSFLPLLENRRIRWPDRALVMQAHRGDRQLPFHHFLLRTRQWKLLRPSGFHREYPSGQQPAPFELYDMTADPLELNNLAESHPEVVADLAKQYLSWFADVSRTRSDNWAPPRIVVGADAAPEVVLTRQDWRRLSLDGGWGPHSQGQWHLDFRKTGPYRMRVRFLPGSKPIDIEIRCGPMQEQLQCAPGSTEINLPFAKFPLGEHELIITLHEESGKLVGPYQVVLEI